MSDADSILDKRAGELAAIDDATIREVIGVAQAAGELRKALNVLDGLLDDRLFEQAAALGYDGLSSAFIFLQRTLGGLQSAELDRQAFTSSIALELGCAYEDVESRVSARLDSRQPKPILSDDEQAAAKARFQRKLDKLATDRTRET